MLPPVLADANVSAQVITFLRSREVDVASISERGLGLLGDRGVLALATAEARIVLTHDVGDFGDLVFHQRQPAHGVLVVRPGHFRPERMIEHIRALLELEHEWEPGDFAVFDVRGFRVRRTSG